MRVIDAYENYGNTIALQDSEIAVTYLEFTNKVNFLANQLNLTAGELVGLRFSKSIDYIITLFAVLKSGNPFVVLNLELPQERLAYMCESLNLTKVITEQDFGTYISDYNASVSYIHDRKVGVSLDDLAYVVFTSGSTGNPKGVKVTHRGVHNIISQQISIFEMVEGSKMILLNSISFDASLSDIFTTLLSGSTLVIPDVGSSVTEQIRKYGVTHLDISPALLNVIYTDPSFSNLQTIVVGGDVLSEEAIKHLRGKVKLVNAYGPTETTICTSMKVIREPKHANCIGVPVEGVRYIVSDGELVIESDACADGYHGLSSDSFAIVEGRRRYHTGDYVSLIEGEYYFHGRKDRQVKIKGFRVELGEVEKIIKRDTLLSSVAVVYTHNQLYCFSTQEVNRDNLSSLPYYMLPDHFVMVTEFKLNTNDKVDYTHLEALAVENGKRSLLQVFSTVLKATNISLDDDWVSLGGDSLSLISLMVALESDGYSVNVEDILAGVKIKDLLLLTENTTALSADFLNGSITPLVLEGVEEVKGHQHVFFTGVTGFFGAHLLHSLLRKGLDETYHCLIRAGSAPEAQSRLLSVFSKYSLPVEGLDLKKLVYVPGDLQKHNFGLTEAAYAELKRTVTKVLHSAAVVNNLMPYRMLYDANVKGTLEVIRLGKPIHYISTLSVFVGSDKNTGTLYESDDLSAVSVLYGGYAQSKYVAERLVVKSKLPHVIYRLGLLTGDSDKPVHNAKDFLSMLIKGVAEIGVLPDIDLTALSFDVSPINFVTSVFTDLYSSSVYDTVYHIANKSGASLDLVYKSLLRRGIKVEKIPSLDFKRTLFSNILDNGTKSILLSLCRFDSDLFDKYRFCDLFQKTDVTFDMTNTMKDANVSFPNVGIELMSHYIKTARGAEDGKTN
jgi:amino acid adenylation domain-containing protein/thioester reductase-like protein